MMHGVTESTVEAVVLLPKLASGSEIEVARFL